MIEDLQSIIKTKRQDSHITEFKINHDRILWNNIHLYDQDEARRLGFRKK